MARREETLIDQIEREALDDNLPLASALRKCIVLGGRSGSERLRDWATRERQGYYGDGSNLPDYRVVNAPLLIDGISGQFQVSRQPYPPSGLPEEVRKYISERVELREGVGGLEALLDQAEIKLSPPMVTDLLRIVNASRNEPYQHITHLYWGLSHATVRGVLDQIRTALTQLVAELRAHMSGDEALPSAETANQAVNVVVTGKRSRISVTTAQTSGSQSPATASDGPSNAPAESGFWTRWRKIGAFVAGTGHRDGRRDRGHRVL